MLKRTVLLTAFAFISAYPSFSQASQPDSQTLQAILTELRAIHNDVRLTAISQILLVEFQTQQTVVNRATQRVDSARLQLSSLQATEKDVASTLAHSESHLNEASDPVDKKQTSETVDSAKASLASLKNKEEGLYTNLQEAEAQLRSAQDVLDGIQTNLNATVKKLQPIAASN